MYRVGTVNVCRDWLVYAFVYIIARRHEICQYLPVGRLGKPEDIARTVEFLVSDNTDFITGSTLSVNGCQPMY